VQVGGAIEKIMGKMETPIQKLQTDQENLNKLKSI
jgi:hypothetical protein